MPLKTKIKNNQAPLLLWLIMADFWSIVSLTSYALDFFSFGKYPAAANGSAVIYVAILAIYVGSKELVRWNTKKFLSKRSGEVFVYLWSATTVMFVFLSIFSQGEYMVPSEFLSTYIAVMGLFAVSRKSKLFKARRKH